MSCVSCTEGKKKRPWMVELFKNHYFYRNWGQKQSPTLLFFGCNYPAIFPKTCRAAIRLLASLGIDWCVDCCGKPVALAGGEHNSRALMQKLEARGVVRLVTACPNCYTRLRKIQDRPVIDLGSFLIEQGLARKIDRPVSVFYPCGDGGREIFTRLKSRIEEWNAPFSSVGCCGLGGPPAARTKSRIEEKRVKMLALAGDGGVDVYCASCGGQFRRFGVGRVRNLLSDLLGVQESPGTWLKGAWYFKWLSHDV